MNNQRVGWLAKLLAVVPITAALGFFGLGTYLVVTAGDSPTFIVGGLVSLCISTTYAIVGMLVAARYPQNPIGWIFIAVGWLDATGLSLSVYRAYGPVLGAAGEVPVLFHDLWLPALLLPTIFVFLLFPDGHLPSPRWRIVFWLAALGLVGNHIAVALQLGPLPNAGLGSHSAGLASLAGVLDIVLPLTKLLLLFGILGSLAAFAIRLRRSRGLERQQMKWLSYALSGVLLSIVFSTVTWSLWAGNSLLTQISDLISNLALLGIAVATGIAILCYRLYDLDVVINRTLVYGVLTGAVVGIHGVTVGGLGALFQNRGSPIVSLAATGLAATLFQPLRERLQRSVNRLMYGERDDPYTVLTRLGQQLEATLDPDAMLLAIVQTIAQTLKLPYAALALKRADEFAVVAAVGSPRADMVRLPLIYQGDQIGQLILSPRAPNEPFTPAEQHLLADIAHQISLAAHAVRLTNDLRHTAADLQRSRERLITTREEERRRLRRDLHDGLGPTLAAQTLKIGSARLLLAHDPAAADELLAELEAGIDAALADIRRLVYALRPPELDELGLVGAICESAAEYSTNYQPNGAALHVSVDAPDKLPPLSAAAEVAAYRIVTEALANVVRHAQARTCQVRLSVAERLCLTISDDGVGLMAHHRAGVGLSSMRERAEELGGSFFIEPVALGGTRVVVQLPLAQMP